MVCLSSHTTTAKAPDSPDQNHDDGHVEALYQWQNLVTGNYNLQESSAVLDPSMLHTCSYVIC